MSDNNPKQIVFFDGVCGLCNRFVNFLIKRNRRGQFKFATLQGKRAQAQGIVWGETGEASVVYVKNARVYRNAEAAIRILTDIGGIWRLAIVLRIIPRTIANAVYRWVARNRYRWFGKRAVCRIPEPHERNYFLD